MSSLLVKTNETRNAQLIATAAVSGIVVASAIFGFQKARRRARIADLKASIPDISDEHVAQRMTEYGAAANEQEERMAALAAKARKGEYDQDLILEQLARNRIFLGDAGLQKLRDAFIVVVGCGGVGSHATAALARSGCSKLRLIDFDQVTLSSLNRHAVATLADVGMPKVHCLRRRLEQVTPWTHFDCRNELFTEQAAAAQLSDLHGQSPDFVIDAIDNIDSKVALLAYCRKKGVQVISSMGAGCKSDPTKIFIGDISASTDDPLSKSTRRRLRAMGIRDGIPVVFSTERPGAGKAVLQPLDEEEVAKGSVTDLSVLPDFRVRILPVLGTMPAIFGLAAANHAILSIAGYPQEYVPSKSRDKMYDGILGALQGAEERLARSMHLDDGVGLKIAITAGDVGYLVEEVYGGRSIISGLSTRLVLIRWNKPHSHFIDLSTPGQKHSLLSMKDLVLMTKEEAVKHEKKVLSGKKKARDVWDAETIERVQKRMKEEDRFARFR